jgi:hypothetical protein
MSDSTMRQMTGTFGLASVVIWLAVFPLYVAQPVASLYDGGALPLLTLKITAKSLSICKKPLISSRSSELTLPVRSIHELFQPLLPQNPHGICVLYAVRLPNTHSSSAPVTPGTLPAWRSNRARASQAKASAST